MTRTPRGAERPTALIAIVVASVVFGLVATVLGIVNAVAIGDESDRREADRISGALSACERGNALREQVTDVGHAGEALVAGVLEVVLTFVRNPDTAAALRQQLEPVFDEHRAAVDQITLIDCQAVTPGATTTTTEPPR